MRNSLYYLLLMLCVAMAGAQPAPPSATEPIYTALPSDVPPELRANRTFVPVRVISQQFGAAVAWQLATRVVVITRAGEPDIRLTIGSRQATIDSRVVTLDAAPYINQGRTMVPLRFIAESYEIPVAYHTPTRSVYLYRDNRVYVLPFPSTATGITIANPLPGQLVQNPVRVQGQGNVYEGNLIIEVQDMGGRLIARTQTTAGMGAFYPYSTLVYYNMPGQAPVDGRIVVYSINGRGDDQILARRVVNVRLSPTS